MLLSKILKRKDLVDYSINSLEYNSKNMISKINSTIKEKANSMISNYKGSDNLYNDKIKRKEISDSIYLTFKRLLEEKLANVFIILLGLLVIKLSIKPLFAPISHAERKIIKSNI